MCRIVLVIDENHNDVATPSSQLGESDDVVARSLPGESVDLLVARARRADIEADASETGVQERGRALLVEERSVAGHAAGEAGFRRLAYVVREMSVEEGLAEAAQADIHFR